MESREESIHQVAAAHERNGVSGWEVDRMKAHQLYFVILLFAAVLLPCLSEPAMSQEMPPEQAAFDKANQRGWKSAFEDPDTDNWRQRWFLDGEVGTVTHDAKGMELKSGPNTRMMRTTWYSGPKRPSLET